MRIFALVILILGIIVAGCTSTVPPQAAVTPEPTQTSLYYYGNGTFDVNGTLQQVNGTLHILSSPPGADIYIDNEYQCRSNCALSYLITPGRHTIEFRLEGYETVVYPVTVERGGMDGINVTLEKMGSRTDAPATATS